MPARGLSTADGFDIRIRQLQACMIRDRNIERFLADRKKLESALLAAGAPEMLVRSIQVLTENRPEDLTFLLARVMDVLYLQGTLHLFLSEMLRGGASPKLTDEFDSHLRALGLHWDRKSKQITATSPIRERKEIIIADAKPYEAYKQIENIIRLCRNELAIIDPWVNEDVFTLYLESLPVSTSIRIITQNMTGKFEAVAKRFSQERKRFEVKIGQVHDRYLIVDDRAWIIGQSLKDAGKKPLAIVELSDTDQARTLFEKSWGSSKKVI